jgi:hypothetical protein
MSAVAQARRTRTTRLDGTSGPLQSKAIGLAGTPRANAVERDAFNRKAHGKPIKILTGTNQRIDILTGRPID